MNLETFIYNNANEVSVHHRLCCWVNYTTAITVRNPLLNYCMNVIYLTNYKRFQMDYIEYCQLNQNDAIYFDVHRVDGLIYTSYTYIPGSMKGVSRKRPWW